jgi:hypothetical protein
MSSFADSIDGFTGGLVVASGGGSYDGPIGQLQEVASCMWENKIALAIMIIVVIVLLFLCTKLFGAKAKPEKSAFSPAHGQRFASSHSGLGLTSAFSQRDRAAEYSSKISPFMNSREAPYYPDVSNRTMRMEDREKEAMRALGKINQERMRRASTPPLPWKPFWNEWKKTHSVDNVNEGFRSGSGTLMPNY